MLWPCSECKRHIRSTEHTCPFCGQSVTGAPPRLRYPHPGLSRAAKLAFFVTLAGASVANCAAPSPEPVAPSEPVKAEAPVDAGSADGVADVDADADADAATATMEEDASHHRVVLMYGATVVHVLELLKFEPFSDRVSKADASVLDDVAEVMKHHTIEIDVEGFAAPNEKVKGLAKRRAQKVVDALVERGVAKERMYVVDRMVTPDPNRPGPHPPSVRFHVRQ